MTYDCETKLEWFCFYSGSQKILLLRLAVVFLLSVQLIYVFPNSFAPMEPKLFNVEFFEYFTRFNIQLLISLILEIEIGVTQMGVIDRKVQN